MARRHAHFVVLSLALGAGCGGDSAAELPGAGDASPTPDASGPARDASEPVSAPDAQAPAADASTPDAAPSAGGVRRCRFVPDESEPAVIAASARDPREAAEAPPSAVPDPTAVAAAVTERQLGVLVGLSQAVIDLYVDPDLNGLDWDAVIARYQALVTGGLRDEDFYLVMQQLIAELGDGHSYFQSPDEVAEDERAVAEGADYVGIGILADPIGDDGQTGSIIAIWPDSPAERAGLQSHDHLLEVDGEPFRDVEGRSRSVGPAGTSFELTYRRLGAPEELVTVTRARVTGSIPVDFCIVPDTRIGYVLVPTFLDDSIGERVAAALEAMSEEAPLEGLVLDQRVNGGGLNSAMAATLSLFLDGAQGELVSRSDTRPLTLEGRDVGGSQTLPLVVLIERDTTSFAEIFSGVLQTAGRATLVGGATQGNVEVLQRVELDDGSVAWLAAETFAPVGLAPGAWEGDGVQPDEDVPSRWDLFDEATDPALARAIELLQ